MKAVAWHGRRDVRVDDVPDPRIEEPTDAVIRVTSSGLYGSDLHLYLTTHALSLDEAPEAYAMFQAKRDGVVKVLFQP